MCGIVGYIGKRNAVDVMLQGLSKLEYRGYDSSGIAIVQGSEVLVNKAEGKLVNLQHKIENLLVINKIVTIHYFEFDKNFVGEAESHDFWEINYADKGQFSIVTDDKCVTLKQGEIFLII